VAAGATGRGDELTELISPIRSRLDDSHQARERGLAASRRVIRLSGSSIRAVHRLDPSRAAAVADEAEEALREAQAALDPFPAVAHAGFLHDSSKEYAEARLTAALVAGDPLPSADALGVEPTAWLRGLAEAASELRRHILDRLRAGAQDRAEELLGTMDDVYDALVGIDYPDALTNGLRRTVDGFRAVLERTRGDVTTTALQMRLQRALEERASDST
jgi:translin